VLAHNAQQVYLYLWRHDKLTCKQDEKKEEGAESADAPADEVNALKDITNEAQTDKSGKPQPRPTRERRERGPPADGIPSKTKVMVANLPYDLTEDKVRYCHFYAYNSPLATFYLTHKTFEGCIAFPSLFISLTPSLAQGPLQGLLSRLRQDCSSPYPPLHD